MWSCSTLATMIVLVCMCTHAYAGACTCSCTADVSCPSKCSSCSWASQYCDCFTTCTSSSYCSSGYSEIERTEKQCDTYWFNSNERVTCRRGCSVRTSQCSQCSTGYYGPSCLQCGTCSGRGVCQQSITGNGQCTCSSSVYKGNNCQYSNAETCNNKGVVNNDGVCTCQNNANSKYTGLNCEQCDSDAGWYNWKANAACTKCIVGFNCEAGSCHPDTGVCVCREGYTGTQCNSCAAGYDGYPNCQRCTRANPCSGNGECSAGTCDCDGLFTGLYCNDCVPGYATASCTACPMRVGQSNPAVAGCSADLGYGYCDDGIAGTGDCVCFPGFGGDACYDGYPLLLSIQGTTGPTKGTDSLVLTGSNFGTIGTVMMGSTPCTPLIYGNDLIRCTNIPPGKVGSVLVTVTNDQSTRVSLDNISYTYDSPVITEVRPAVSPAVGSVISLLGRNFGTGGKVSLYGEELAHSLYSHEKIVFTAPAGVGTTHTLLLQVETYAGDYADVQSNLSYYGPELASALPSLLRTRGGQTLELTGENFGPYEDRVAVTVGGSACTALTLHSDRRITCSMPANVGEVDVLVTVASQTASLPYQYGPPQISGTPSGCMGVESGVIVGCRVAGDELITIRGENFGTINADLNVFIGDDLCTGVEVLTAHTAVTCRTPSSSGYLRPVKITRATQESEVARIVSYAGPLIFAGTLSIDGGSEGDFQTAATTEGAQLTFKGQNFGTVEENAHVYVGPVDVAGNEVLLTDRDSFGRTVTTAYTCTIDEIADGQITCTLGPGVGGPLYLFVTKQSVGQLLFSNLQLRCAFHYPMPTITPNTIRLPYTSVGPAFVQGKYSEGDLVTFEGASFGDGHDRLRVTYGPYEGIVDSFDGSTITIKTVPGDGNDYTFKVFVGYGTAAQVANGTDRFNYPARPKVFNVTGCPEQDGALTTECPTTALDEEGNAVVLVVAGMDFGTVGATVVVGNKRCADVQHVEGEELTKLTCILPANVGAKKTIVVSQGDLYSFATEALSYSVPLIESISGCVPDANYTKDCPRTPNTPQLITIRGSFFGKWNAKVIVGGAQCENVMHSLTTPEYELTCELPWGAGDNQKVILLQNQGRVSDGDAYLSFVPCPAGTKINDLTCEPCASGEYSEASGQFICQKCVKGKYTNGIHSTGCTPCARGTYAEEDGASECEMCERGSVAEDLGTVDCKRCSVGYEMPNRGKSKCNVCDLGYYQDDYPGIICKSCPAGKASNILGAESCDPCDNGYWTDALGSTACSPCSAGEYSLGTPCASCPKGRATNQEATAECEKCAQGTHSNREGAFDCEDCKQGSHAITAGQSLCDACQPGSFAEDDRAIRCEPCPLGTYAEDNKTSVCEPCLSGYYQNKEGQVQCKACIPGEVQVTTGQIKCLKCMAGRYSVDNASSFCTKCEPGRYSNTSNEGGASTCLPCEPGRYGTGTDQCHECLKGEYTSVPESSDCVSCKAGKYAGVQGMKNCTDCDAGKSSGLQAAMCRPCYQGKYAATNGSATCSLCELGRYNGEEGQVACKACSTGNYSLSEGAVDCVACEAGKWTNETGSRVCKACLAGQYSYVNFDRGATVCTDCIAGSYSPIKASARCFECKPGTVAPMLGMSKCDECDLGMYQDQYGNTTCKDCPLGRSEGSRGSIICDLCQPGQHQDIPGQQTCQDCDVGKAQLSLGQEYCDNCTIGRANNAKAKPTCAACLPGFFSNNTGFETCMPCAIGKHASENGATVCDQCTAGKATDNPGQSDCTSCTPGYFADENGMVTCKKCVPGKHQANSFSSSCDNCTAGRFAIAFARPVCSPCEPGTYTAENSTKTCKNCEQGTEQPTSGKSRCEDCVRGKFSKSGQDRCDLCRPGSATNLTQQHTCQPCAKGKAQILEGRLECSACLEGRYTGATGAATCVACDPGNYQNSTNSEQCKKCPGGKFQKLPAMPICNDCDPGFQAEGPGNTECAQCPYRKVAPASGMESCVSCDKNAKHNERPEPHTKCVCDIGYFEKNMDARSASEFLQCVECPDGVFCDEEGQTEDRLAVRPGWWRTGNQSMLLSRCERPFHCSGGVSSDCDNCCGENRVGPLCALCAPNHRSNGHSSTCEECAENVETDVGWSIFFFILLLLALVAVYAVMLKADRVSSNPEKIDIRTRQMSMLQDGEDAFDTVSPGTFLPASMEPMKIGTLDMAPERELGSDAAVNEATMVQKRWKRLQTVDLGQLSEREERIGDIDKILDKGTPSSAPSFTFQFKVILAYLQIILSLTWAVQIEWPSYYREFINYFDIVNFDFIPWQSVSCVVELNYLSKMVLYCITPMILLALVGLAFWARWLCLNKNSMKTDMSNEELTEKKEELNRTIAKFLLFTVFLIYPKMSQISIGMFICREVDGKVYMRNDYLIECYSEEWTRYMPAGVVFVLVYPIGIPLFYLFLLWHNRYQLADKTVRMKYGFLYRAFNLKNSWFELVDMLHKCFLIALIPFFPLIYQMPVGMVACGSYTILILLRNPYLLKGTDRLHILVNTYIILTMLMVHILVDYPVLEPVTDLVLSMLLIGLVVGAISLTFLIAGRNIHKMTRNYQRRKRDLKCHFDTIVSNFKKEDSMNDLLASKPKLERLSSKLSRSSKPKLEQEKSTFFFAKKTTGAPSAAPSSPSSRSEKPVSP